jgi:hypothetical protein
MLESGGSRRLGGQHACTCGRRADR